MDEHQTLFGEDSPFAESLDGDIHFLLQPRSTSSFAALDSNVARRHGAIPDATRTSTTPEPLHRSKPQRRCFDPATLPEPRACCLIARACELVCRRLPVLVSSLTRDLAPYPASEPVLEKHTSCTTAPCWALTPGATRGPSNLGHRISTMDPRVDRGGRAVSIAPYFRTSQARLAAPSLKPSRFAIHPWEKNISLLLGRIAAALEWNVLESARGAGVCPWTNQFFRPWLRLSRTAVPFIFKP